MFSKFLQNLLHKVYYFVTLAHSIKRHDMLKLIVLLNHE